MILVVFDFDHTVVDGNTDVKILDVFGEKDPKIKYRFVLKVIRHVVTEILSRV